MGSPRTECILQHLLLAIRCRSCQLFGACKKGSNDLLPHHPMSYVSSVCPDLLCHISLKFGSIKVTKLFLLLGKKDKRHLQFKKAILGNNLGVCTKYNVEFRDILSLSYALYPYVIFIRQKLSFSY